MPSPIVNDNAADTPIVSIPAEQVIDSAMSENVTDNSGLQSTNAEPLAADVASSADVENRYACSYVLYASNVTYTNRYCGSFELVHTIEYFNMLPMLLADNSIKSSKMFHSLPKRCNKFNILRPFIGNYSGKAEESTLSHCNSCAFFSFPTVIPDEFVVSFR